MTKKPVVGSEDLGSAPADLFHLLFLEDGGRVINRVVESDQSAGELLEKSGYHGKPTHMYEDGNREMSLWELDSYLILYARHLESKMISLYVHEGPGSGGGLRIMEHLLEGVVAPEQNNENDLLVRFWFSGARGATSVAREVSAPAWHEISGNYSDSAQEALGRLIGTEAVEMSGRIGILYGAPGTGKTTAVRMLAREWRDWCEIHYVMDPENFFGSAEYMMSVLMTEAQGAQSSCTLEYQFMDSNTFDGEVVNPPRKWRLVVIEDAEEFLVPDSKQKIGQALSRLLNMGDGIIGHGTEVLILFTTNEPLEKMNPAIVRPGRCFAKVEVPSLSRDEMLGWCDERGLPRPITRVNENTGRSDWSLADLYEYERAEKDTQVLTKEKPSSVGGYL